MKGLKVDELQVSFGGRAVVKGISFEIPPGARVGLIGESGSGKSVTALSLMGLLDEGAQVSGSISLDGQELLSLADRQLAQLRGAKIGMIFQEPMTALDPTMRVGKQVAEVLGLHQRGKRGKHEEVIKMLERVVQAKVLRLLDKELAQGGSACLFISHDLAVVNQICEYLLVMYQGQIVERGPLRQVLDQPQHPYTRGLLATANITAVAPGQPLPVLSDFFRGSDE